MVQNEYAVNGSAGAFTSIPFTIPARKVEVVEVNTAAFPAQGVDEQQPKDAFAATRSREPDEIIQICDQRGSGGRGGAILGWPAQSPASGGSSNKAADTAIKLRSRTVTATKVRVTEWE